MKVILPFRTSMPFHHTYDGGTKYINYLSQYLAKEGIDVTVISSLLGNKKIKSKNYKKVKYKFIWPRIMSEKRLIKLNSPYKLAFSYNLKKFLEKEKFDIMHSFEMLAYFYLHKKKRIPVIFQGWGLEPFYSPLSLSQKGLRKLYLKMIVRHPWGYCLKNSEKVAIDGEFQIPYLKKLGIKREKMFILPNGINIQEIEKIEKKHKNKRKDLGIKKDDLVILNVNQIVPDKGIDDLINAFALLKKQIKNSKLIIIGSGNLEEMMHNLIKKHKLEKDVFHLKNISEEELYDYYFSSDIFVSATLQYDFKISIQEAMACSLPVISSAQPFLVKEGANGYVVGMKNPKGIKDGVLKIYDKNLIKKMGMASKRLVKQYDWKNVAKTAIKEYEKLE